MELSQTVLPPLRMHSGNGSLMRLRNELERCGAKRAIVFCGRSLSGHPEAIRVLQSALGSYYVGIYDGVQAHSPIESVTAAAECLRDERADSVIALGGGSAIVTARAASIVYAERKSPLELCTRRDDNGQLASPKLLCKKIPQFVIPTTPTTAAVKAGSAVQDTPTGDRLALYDPKTRAQCIFIEPMMINTSPAALCYSAGLNTLTMAICGLEASNDNPYADALLRHSAELVFTWLPKLGAQPEETSIRFNLVYAALLCGSGTDLTGGGLVTALSHSLGPATGIANGIINAVLLPHAMRFNESIAGYQHRKIVESLTRSNTDGHIDTNQNPPRLVQDFLTSTGAPTSLRELGVDPCVFEEVVEKTMDDWSLTKSPRTVTPEHLLDILHTAWQPAL